MSSSPAFDLDNEFGDRFWFWTGASGKRYIHSVYQPEDCPPLPGAIFIEVCRMADGSRKALGAGRFSPLWDLAASSANRLDAACREVHVHLLAEDETATARVLDDLRAGLGIHVAPTSPATAAKASPASSRSGVGFGEQPSLPLFAGLAA
jgi:hypothetical protein